MQLVAEAFKLPPSCLLLSWRCREPQFAALHFIEGLPDGGFMKLMLLVLSVALYEWLEEAGSSVLYHAVMLLALEWWP
ncbi:hypothetical protein Nepgr_001049 [Nepenthes gracilis]|uniref:Uncharacterized protein n=1 Tax=Nepenthes gracilis TaxID=150966 RepID=A0AAD3RXG0_NEPGR|nr:hypothetical protein Nepgr_001049 [Nepenthes gracilis]